MGVFNWLGLAASGSGLLGSDKAKEFAEYFSGSMSIVLGNFMLGVYGERDTHIFGSDIKLLVHGSAGGLAGLFGQAMSSAGPLGLLLTGIGGDVSFCYGPRIGVTYGGPHSTILRGPMIKKTSFAPPANPMVNWLFGEQKLAGGYPEQVAGLEIQAQDAEVMTAVTLLSTLLNLSTAALELAIRFKYPNFDPKTNKDAFAAGNILRLVAGSLSDRIMGVIYGIELAGGWSNYWTGCLDNAKQGLKTIGQGLEYAGDVVTLASLRAWYARSTDETKNIFIAVMIVIGWLVLVGVIIGVTIALTKK